MLDQVTVVTLDLDDTLWDIGAVIRRAEANTGAWLKRHAPALRDFLHQTDVMALRDRIVAEHPAEAHDFSFVRRAVYREAATAVGVAESLADGAFDEFFRWRNTVDLYSDVEEGLQGLASRYRLVALTNGNADLATVGIDEHFVDSVNPRRAGAPKPEPHMFRLAAKLTASAPEAMLHVGDDPVLDVDAARRAGYQTVWMNRRGEDWPQNLPAPQLTVTTLSELVTRLAEARS